MWLNQLNLKLWFKPDNTRCDLRAGTMPTESDDHNTNTKMPNEEYEESSQSHKE